MNPKVLRWLTPSCLAAMALIAATIALGSSGRDDPPARAAGNFSPYVTKDGGISRPTDYRDTFEYLGSYAVATKPDKPLDEMHVVYARPEDVRAYRRDGKFPDGATLVKEVTRVGSDKLTTGQSHWATDIKLWFVMIKDAKGRFPGNDLWGDGLAIVLLWIGGMMFTAYQAEGIRPLVANSPLMSWVYRVMSAGRFSSLLGVVEIAIGVLIALRPVWPMGSAVGSGLAAGMFLTTLSFLVTTPGWEPSLGGFPALSAMPGQSLLKDVVLF